MRKTLKVFSVVCLLTTMFGCTKIEDREEEPSTTLVTTTTPVSTKLPIDEVAKQDFEKYHILDLSITKAEIPFETENLYVYVNVKNTSDKSIYLDALLWGQGDKLRQNYLEAAGEEITPSQEKAYLKTAKYEERVEWIVKNKPDFSSYSYHMGEQQYEVNLHTKRAYVKPYREELMHLPEPTYPTVPTIPNHGITIFTWEEYGKRVYDYLPGLGEEVCPKTILEYQYKPHPLYDSVGDIDIMMENKDVIFYVTGVKELSDEALAYVDKVFEYKGYQYVTDLNDPQTKEHEYISTLIVYTKEEGECPYPYCGINVYNTMDYTFSAQDLAKVGNRKLTEEDILKLMEENTNLQFYIQGLYEPLSDSLIEKYVDLFQFQVQVEGQVIYAAEKPVIYLYPEEEMDVSVKLEHNGKLNTTYPAYKDGWFVHAKSDGTLYNYADGQEYSYLFWEGEAPASYDLSEGFVVKKEDSVAFLQDKLAYLGLTPREYNEFIVYWLPYLNKHPYNLITFQEESYTNVWKLDISPKPDSIQRVFMVFEGLEESIEIPEQQLTPWKRQGFSVVEWGGVELK